jgi:hypothetical protein
MMPENNWYGHTFVLARYCGLQILNPPIYGSLPHGWRPDYSNPGRLALMSAPLFAWNESQASAATTAGVQHAMRIGAPFIYACRSLLGDAEGDIPAGTGTLCMPQHSVPGWQSTQDHSRFIAEVEATETGPFTVALFYVDMSRSEVVSPYETAGWRVVSFGRRDENLFVYRVITEMVRHRSVVSDQVGTPVWYGAHLGRRVRIVGPPAAHLYIDDANVFRDRWPSVFGAGVEGEEARALADLELDGSCILAPDALREALGWSSASRMIAAYGVRWAVDRRHGKEARRGN